MEEVIKAVLEIDKNAINMEEDAKEELSEKEMTKKKLFKVLKDEIESKTKTEIEAFKQKTEAEIEEEMRLLKETGDTDSANLKKKYEEFSDKLVNQAFESVLRSLED